MGRGCRKADLFSVPERVAVKHRTGSLVSEMTSQAYCSRATKWKVGWNDSLVPVQLQGIMTLNLQKLPNYYMLNAKPVSKGNLILIYYFHFQSMSLFLKNITSALLLEISEIELLFFGDFISCLQIVVGEHQLESSDNHALLWPIGISLFKLIIKKLNWSHSMGKDLGRQQSRKDPAGARGTRRDCVCHSFYCIRLTLVRAEDLGGWHDHGFQTSEGCKHRGWKDFI